MYLCIGEKGEGHRLDKNKITRGGGGASGFLNQGSKTRLRPRLRSRRMKARSHKEVGDVSQKAGPHAPGREKVLPIVGAEQ